MTNELTCVLCGHTGLEHNLTDSFPYTACSLCECKQYSDRLDPSPPDHDTDFDTSDDKGDL